MGCEMEKISISVNIRTEGKRIMIVERERGTRQRKTKNAVREAQTVANVSPHTSIGLQLLQAAVLRNELAVHLVAEVAEHDGLEQPEIVHHLQGGTVGRSPSSGGSGSVLPRIPWNSTHTGGRSRARCSGRNGGTELGGVSITRKGIAARGE